MKYKKLFMYRMEN